MLSIYNLASKVAYVCQDRSGANHTTRALDEMDIEMLSTKYEVKLNIDINIVVASNVSNPSKVQWSRREMDLASIMNALNRPFMKGTSPLVFELLSMCPDELVITNTCNEDAHIFLYADQYVGVVPAGGATMVEVNHLINLVSPSALASDERPYVVVGDVPILRLKATLQRKNFGGSYVREETLVIKSGVFHDEEEFVEHINKCITMRGERNGFIYHIEMKDGVLVVHATHRQPNGSFIEITPLYPLVGINKRVTFPLRTKGKVEFDWSCGIVLDKNILARRMY